MRHLGTLVLLVCAAACQPPGGDPDPDVGGPTSDWPHGGILDGTGITAGAAGSPADSRDRDPTAVAPSTGSTTGGTTGGASSTGTTGTATASGGTTAGAAAPMASSDAGAVLADAGAAGGTGTTADAGTSSGQGDGGLADAGVPEGGAPEAGLPDASVGDAGCTQASAPDASMCPGYGCRTTLQQLRASMDRAGACTSNEALALACAGVVTNAALQCTQENVFSASLERAVGSCLKRDPRLAPLGSDCLDCYVDEALCMLSRCFAACTVTSGSACQSCRRQQCSGPLTLCTGLPTPP